MQYSIWLIPSSPTFEYLQNIIHRLADEHKAPTFEPHITVLGNVERDLHELTEKMNKIAMNIRQFELNLGETSFSSTYFQSVFVRVQSDASLMQLHVDLKDELQIENPPFMPHISLLYGNYDIKTREKIASAIHFPPTSFIVKECIITPAISNPHEWNHIVTIPFGI